MHYGSVYSDIAKHNIQPELPNENMGRSRHDMTLVRNCALLHECRSANRYRNGTHLPMP
jgi:hypothetical protein